MEIYSFFSVHAGREKRDQKYVQIPTTTMYVVGILKNKDSRTSGPTSFLITGVPDTVQT
jgi:hypothetical protein